MPDEGEDFRPSGGEELRLAPGYFIQYVAVPGRGAGKWILRCPGGAAVAEYAAGAATKGSDEGAAAEHQHANL